MQNTHVFIQEWFHQTITTRFYVTPMKACVARKYTHVISFITDEWKPEDFSVKETTNNLL